MSESRPSVTGVLPNTNNFVQRANDVLSQNISDVEKEQLLRQLLGSQVAGDSYTTPPQSKGDDGNKPRHYRNPRDEWRGRRNRHFEHIRARDPFIQLQSPFIPAPFDILNEQSSLMNMSTFGRPFGRRFIGQFDLMEPTFFGSSRLQNDVNKMFDDQDLEHEYNTEEASKHLKFTSKVMSIGPDGVKRTRVVNGVTKIGKDGKPMTHKKMISSDESGKTITEVFEDGTERTTKRPFIKGKDHMDDSD